MLFMLVQCLLLFFCLWKPCSQVCKLLSVSTVEEDKLDHKSNILNVLFASCLSDCPNKTGGEDMVTGDKVVMIQLRLK